MATEVERMTVVFEANVKKFENQLKRQNAQFSKITKEIEQNASAMESTVTGAFDNIAKVVGLAVVTREIAKLADTWQSATNKIKAAGVGDAMAGAVSNEIADIATRSRAGFEEVASLYARLTRTGKEFGATQGEVAIATETVSKALKVSGATGSEVQSTLVQLGQALGSGKLQGDELRSLLENAPVVAQAIAKEFGVAVGALKDLGAEGKLTSDRVFKALVNAAPEVAAAFAKTNATIADSFTILQNAALKFVGNSKEMGRAAQLASGGVQLLAANLDTVATGAAALGAILASRLVAAGLTPMVAQMGAAMAASTALSSGLAAVGTRAVIAAGAATALRGALALVGGPVGAAILGTAAVVGYLATESAKGKESTDRYAAALVAMGVGAGEAKAAVKGVGDEIANTSKRMNDAAQDGLKGRLKEDADEAKRLETALRSAAVAVSGTISAAGVNAEDKKRGIDLLTKGLEGNAEQALDSAKKLRELGETNISFANAFGTIATMLTQLAAVRGAAIATKSALDGVQASQAGEGILKTRRDEQGALVKSGFVPDTKLPDPNADPLLAGIKLQAKVREAEMDKGAKALKDKTQELYKAALESGGGVTLAQAGAAAKAIIAAEDAQKGGSKKEPKSDGEKAEDRLDKYTDSLRRQNEVLDAEIATFGKSNAEKRAAIELAKAGVDLNRLDAASRAEVTASLTKEIELSEQKRNKLKELQDAQKALNDAQKFFGDAAVDALEDIIVNGGKAEDVIRNLAKSLAKAALQAALMGSGPLAGIFGTTGQNGQSGGLFGSLFSMLKPTALADGGRVSGPGTGRSDSILAKLSNGEHVTNAKSTRKYGSLLDAINNDKLPKFAKGGFVGTAMSTPSIPRGFRGGGGGMKVVVNNTESDKVQATPQQQSNGDMSILISAIEARIADNVIRGKGSLSPALAARQTNRQLRG